MAANASLIAFPEVTVPLVSQLRSFVKACQVSNYTKKMKQLLDKVAKKIRFRMCTDQIMSHFALSDQREFQSGVGAAAENPGLWRSGPRSDTRLAGGAQIFGSPTPGQVLRLLEGRQRKECHEEHGRPRGKQ